MSTRQEGGMDDIRALVPDATAPEADALVALFAHAAAPAAPGALPGEAAALAAFRAAQRPAAPVARRAKILASLTTLLTVKTAAAALAVTTVGGIAIATGNVPAPLTTAVHHVVPRAHHHATHPAPDPVRSEHPTGDPAELRTAAHDAAVADEATVKPETSYRGLCTAFTAGNWDNTRVTGNPAFARLVAVAPEGDVAGFCGALTTEITDSDSAVPHRPAAEAPGAKATAKAHSGTKAGHGKAAAARKPAAKHTKVVRGKDVPASRSKAAAARAGHAH